MLFEKRHLRPAITRQDAMAACPLRTPALREQAAGDDLKVTVKCRRPRWQRALGALEFCEHTFMLDTLGREVYAACDGSASVASIIGSFAARHHLSVSEAELAVTRYLRTLMMRGLLTMRLSGEVETGGQN